MSTICIICCQKHNETNISSFYEPYYENLSLYEILTTISHIKINEETQSREICQECLQVIINFYNLIRNYQEREQFFNNNKKEEVFFLDEQGYDTYVECETESYKESDEEEEEETIQEDDDNNKITIKENKISTNVINNNNNKIFDEMGNEEIHSKKYCCKNCGDSFLYKSGFSSHMVLKHNTYLESHMFDDYSTPIIIKLPPITGNPINFIRKPAKPKLKLNNDNSKCQICKLQLDSPKDLKEHYNTHKTHICEHCGAGFIKNSYLRDHLLVHTTEKRYPCDICGKKFKYRNGLSVHKNVHVNLRGFMCDTCGCGFNAKSTLKTHMKLKHTNERNFPCPECDLTFKIKSWLDKHYQRKHTLNRTKDFVCNICGIAYLNKTTLTRHLSEKHTGTPVRHYCTVCDKSYCMKTKLNMHMQKKHNIILNNTPSQLTL